MIHATVSYLRNIDLALFHIVNGFCGRNVLLDQLVYLLESLHLKGLAFMSTFGLFWFQRSKTLVRQRETLILLLLAIILAVVVARFFADLLPFRTRPLHTSGIGFRPPFSYEEDTALVDWNSFPSDNAAVLFAMTTGFWLLSRWVGILWACFSLVTSAAARIYLGFHYPSDVTAGALIGICVMLVVNNEFMRSRIASPILAVEQRTPGIYYCLFFPFLFELSTLFAYTRFIRHAVFQYFFGQHGAS
jgi:membrane-associated phospholipid phosphatase